MIYQRLAKVFLIRSVDAGHSQTLTHSYRRVLGLTTWRCEHCEVPSGGTASGWIGLMEAGGKAQTPEQIGGISIEVSHSGCI